MKNERTIQWTENETIQKYFGKHILKHIIHTFSL